MIENLKPFPFSEVSFYPLFNWIVQQHKWTKHTQMNDLRGEDKEDK